MFGGLLFFFLLDERANARIVDACTGGWRGESRYELPLRWWVSVCMWFLGFFFFFSVGEVEIFCRRGGITSEADEGCWYDAGG